MKQLTPHLYWIEDTCSVYLVVKGEKGLLIDCGTGFLPAALETTPIRKVDQLLLTHFHRDQCSAAAEWVEHGVWVGVPFAEKRFLEEADLLRASYDIFDNYTSFYPCFSPLRDVVSEPYVKDYSRFEWQEINFEVVPLPGHTFGSVGYLFEIDGKRVLACGDLMAGPGKIREYYWTQWQYMDFQGHANLLESLKVTVSLKIDLILPGHGEPFEATGQAVGQLQKPLERLYQLFYGRSYPYFRPQFRALSEHVYEVSNSSANTYIVRDDQGHALFLDCGYTATEPISGNPHRFIDHLSPYLADELGIDQVEWFLPSHYHDDHLAGFPMLKNRYGTRLLSSPELKDILEHPERFDMPCLMPEGFPVDRVVRPGEVFQWRGIRFFLQQHPGQTLYHHLIEFEVDGKKFLSIGDNVSGLSFSEKRDYIHSFIPKNRTPVSSYPDMPRQILKVSPDLLLTGHGGGVCYNQDKVRRWQAWMEEWQDLFTQILGETHPDIGMDPRWIEFVPYKVRIRPGQQVTFKLVVTNHELQDRSCIICFRSLPEVQLKPDKIDLRIAGGDKVEEKVTATFPTIFRTHSLPILADVTWDGRRLGEIAEAVAYW